MSLFRFNVNFVKVFIDKISISGLSSRSSISGGLMSAQSVFKTFNSILDQEISRVCRDQKRWVSNPSADFSRSRSSLSFGTVFRSVFRFNDGPISAIMPIVALPDDSSLPPWDSALCAARKKINPEAYTKIFTCFNEKTRRDHLFNGYRVFAVDGSEQGVSGSSSTKHMKSHSKNDSERLFVHINALYDVLENTYEDAIIQPGGFRNEDEALLELAASMPADLLHSSVLTADRGYESLILFYRLERNGARFVIRIKDINSYNSLLKGFDFPDDEEFDSWFSFILSKSPVERAKNPFRYKYIANYKNVPEFCSSRFLDLNIRMVRFPLEKADGTISWECLATNLDEDSFTAQELKTLYGLRWNEETSFNHLKHRLSIGKLRSRTLGGIEQEVFAKMTLYNLASRVRNHLERKKKGKKHSHRLSLSNVILQVRQYLFNTGLPEHFDIDAFLTRETCAVMEGRANRRPKYRRQKKR